MWPLNKDIKSELYINKHDDNLTEASPRIILKSITNLFLLCKNYIRIASVSYFKTNIFYVILFEYRRSKTHMLEMLCMDKL